MKLTSHTALSLSRFLEAIDRATNDTGITVEMGSLWYEGEMLGDLRREAPSDGIQIGEYRVESTE